MKFVRNLDFFTKAKEDIDTSSGIGGAFSILGFTLGLLFLVIEIFSFISVQWVSEMSVDSETITKKENLNLDLTFHKAPCILLSLTYVEEGANPVVDLPIRRGRYNQQGLFLGFYVTNSDPKYRDSDAERQDMITAINDQEYCKIDGNVTVLEIPGNIHVGYQTKLHNVMLLEESLLEKVSLDLTINHLTFGLDMNHRLIQKKLGSKDQFASYDGFDFRGVKPNEKINIFLKAVSNYYYLNPGLTGDDGPGLLAYQYSFSYQKKEITHYQEYITSLAMGGEAATFQINFEFSPITINHRKVQNSFARFIVDTLAIVGGIFSVMGMINSQVLLKFRNHRGF